MIDAQETAVKEPARELFSKGLTAAQIQDWTLAVNYFREALEKDRQSSTIWYNLALASAKLPDHEFRALALFKAY